MSSSSGNSELYLQFDRIVESLITIKRNNTNFSYQVDDEDINEIEFLIQKFSHKKWKSKRNSGTQQDSTELVNIIKNCLPNSHAEKKDMLESLVKNWGEDMYLLLKYLGIVTNNTGLEFPFGNESLEIGNSFNFPTASSPKAVNYTYNSKTRLGRSETGKGEILVALLTNSLPVINGVGDIINSEKHWEVKDLTNSPGGVRLGGTISKKIIYEINLQGINILSRNPDDIKYINSIIGKVIKEAGIFGFVTIKANKISCLSPDSAKFVSYMPNSDRIQINF